MKNVFLHEKFENYNIITFKNNGAYLYDCRFSQSCVTLYSISFTLKWMRRFGIHI